MKYLRTGKLRHRIEVFKYHLNGKRNGLGEDEREMVKVGTFWADIESRTGSLLKGRTADTILTETTHVISLRYTDKIDNTCFIKYKGRRFDIDYISDPDFGTKIIEVFARENRD